MKMVFKQPRDRWLLLQCAALGSADTIQPQTRTTTMKMENQTVISQTNPLLQMIFGTICMAAGFILATSSIQAATYTFSPTATSVNWTDSMWAPSSPGSGAAGDVIRLSKISTNTTLKLDVNPTFGVLDIGPTGVGSGTRSWTIGEAGQSFTLDNGTNAAQIINTSGGTATIRAKITTTNDLVFDGPYTILLSDTANSFQGNIIMNGGSVFVYNSASISTNHSITFSNSCSLAIGNTVNAGQILYGDVVILSNKVGTIVANTTHTNGLEIRGDISGAGSLVLNVAGTNSAAWSNNVIKLLSTNNTYAGSTEIRTHVLFQGIKGFGQGDIVFTTNSRSLIFDAGNTADITTNYLGNVRGVVLNADTAINTGTNNVTFANPVTGTSSLIKTGSGTLTLEGNNSFTGAVLLEGSLAVGHENALGGQGYSLQVAANTTLGVLSGTHLKVKDLDLLGNAEFLFTLTSDFEATQIDVFGDQVGARDIMITIAPDSNLLVGEYTLLQAQGAYDPGLNFALAPASSSLGSLSWNSGELKFASTVPEPGTVALLLTSLAGLVLWKKRGRRQTRLPAILGLCIMGLVWGQGQIQAQETEGLNLAPNPSFEETMETNGVVLPVKWLAHSGDVGIRADNTQAHDEVYSLNIPTPVSGSVWIRSENIKVNANTKYKLEAAVLSHQPAGRGLVPFYGFRVYESDGGWNPRDGTPYLISRENNADDGEKWQMKSGTFTTREDTTWLYIGILVDAQVAGSVYVDEVSLKVVSE